MFIKEDSKEFIGVAGWIWMVEVDAVKSGNKFRVIRLGGVIIVKN